jgi:hypothetical protein
MLLKKQNKMTIHFYELEKKTHGLWYPIKIQLMLLKACLKFLINSINKRIKFSNYCMFLLKLNNCC